MFVRDIRDGERGNSPKMQPHLQIIGHFSPRQLHIRPIAMDPHFEEVAIPDRMSTFSVDPSGWSALLKPDQDMANAISLEHARGRRKIPARAPFIYPRIAEPWPVSKNEHPASIAKRCRNTRQALREPLRRGFPIQAFILYRVRFLIAAELLGSLPTFGGIAGGINHLSIMPNIATTDAIDVALAYDRLVRQHLEEKDRDRPEAAPLVGYCDSFLSDGNDSFFCRLLVNPHHARIPRKSSVGCPPKSTAGREPSYASASSLAPSAAGCFFPPASPSVTGCSFAYTETALSGPP